MFQKAILGIIRVYQFALSPDQGIFRRGYGVCRFYPTCSQYLADAIKKYGILKGFALAIKRIGRCHPWSEGGFDPVK